MATTPGRKGARRAPMLKATANAILGRIAVWVLKGIRRIDPERVAEFSAALMRRVGPLIPEHRTGRANLKAAFPEKSAAEIEEILTGVWDNLGRVAAEYPHLDRLWDIDPDN